MTDPEIVGPDEDNLPEPHDHNREALHRAQEDTDEIVCATCGDTDDLIYTDRDFGTWECESCAGGASDPRGEYDPGERLAS